MGQRMAGLIVGSLTGMLLGAVLVVAVCAGIQTLGDLRLGKLPLLLIAVVGMPLGGFVGGMVGLRMATDEAGENERDADG